MYYLYTKTVQKNKALILIIYYFLNFSTKILFLKNFILLFLLKIFLLNYIIFIFYIKSIKNKKPKLQYQIKLVFNYNLKTN